MKNHSQIRMYCSPAFLFILSFRVHKTIFRNYFLYEEKLIWHQILNNAVYVCVYVKTFKAASEWVQCGTVPVILHFLIPLLSTMIQKKQYKTICRLSQILENREQKKNLVKTEVSIIVSVQDSFPSLVLTYWITTPLPLPLPLPRYVIESVLASSQRHVQFSHNQSSIQVPY